MAAVPCARNSRSDFAVKQHHDRDDGTHQQQGTQFDRSMHPAISAGRTFPDSFHYFTPTLRTGVDLRVLELSETMILIPDPGSQD